VSQIEGEGGTRELKWREDLIRHRQADQHDLVQINMEYAGWKETEGVGTVGTRRRVE
jgi:hypothetical protein